MSHMTRAATTIKDGEILKKAFKRLGWEFEEGKFNINLYGKQETAEFLLARDTYNKSNGAVGLSKQADGTYAMVGDPYHAGHNPKISKYYRKEKDFAVDLQVAYAQEEAIQKMTEQSYYMSSETTDAEGNLVMTFESMY